MVRQPEFFVELQFFSYLKTCIVSDTILKGKICMLTRGECCLLCINTCTFLAFICVKLIDRRNLSPAQMTDSYKET